MSVGHRWKEVHGAPVSLFRLETNAGLHCFLSFCQKLPKVNRNLAEKLIEEKRDTKKHTVSVCYCNLHSMSSSSSEKPPPPSKNEDSCIKECESICTVIYVDVWDYS